MGSSPSAPSVPTQAENLAGQEQAAALTQQYSQYGGTNPFGSIQFTGEPGSDRQMEVSSPLLEALAGEMSTSYGDEAAQRAESAVYDQFSQTYDPQFERQEESLRNRLIQQGLPVGSEAYEQAMSDLRTDQDSARLSALNQSVLTGQNTQSSQLANLLAMTQSANPLNYYQSGIGTGTQFSNPVTDEYAMNYNNYQNELDSYNSKWGTLGGLAAAGIGGALAGPVGGTLASSLSGLFTGSSDSGSGSLMSSPMLNISDWRTYGQ